ncbi:MAG: M28 family peptidase [Planctomycetota bacterium]
MSLSLRLFAPLLLTASAFGQENDSAADAEIPRLDTITVEDLREHVEFLASDKLQGRAAGTKGNERAAAYISKCFKDYGFERVASNGRSWFQPFEAESAFYKSVPTKNVIGFLPGTDESLSDEIVVIGAHFDHVGLGKFGSREARDSDVKDEIHNGADDNASGSAGLLELAQALSEAPTRRGILFIAFSAEELGLLGSVHYCENPVRPHEQTIAMFNFDMIGRSEDDYLFLGGTGTSPLWSELIEEHIEPSGLNLELGRGGHAPTDSSSFYDVDLPVLFFHTNLHVDYHRVSDHPEFINYGSEAQILRAAYRLIRTVADRDEPIGFSRADAEATPASSDAMNALPTRARDLARMARGRARAKIDKKGCGRLGFIPSSGLRGQLVISEILAEGPAGEAGLDTGDIILQVGDAEVSRSRDVAEALAGVKAGTEISIRYKRRKETETVQITVGK